MRLFTTIAVAVATLQVSALPQGDVAPKWNEIDEKHDHPVNDIPEAGEIPEFTKPKEVTDFKNPVPDEGQLKSNDMLPSQLAAEHPEEEKNEEPPLPPPPTDGVPGHGPKQHDIHHPETEEVEFSNKIPEGDQSSSNDVLPANMQGDQADGAEERKEEEKHEEEKHEGERPVEEKPEEEKHDDPPPEDRPAEPAETSVAPDELPPNVMLVQDDEIPEPTSRPEEPKDEEKKEDEPKEEEKKEEEGEQEQIGEIDVSDTATRVFVEGFPTHHTTLSAATETVAQTTTSTTSSFVPDATTPSVSFLQPRKLF